MVDDNDWRFTVRDIKPLPKKLSKFDFAADHFGLKGHQNKKPQLNSQRMVQGGNLNTVAYEDFNESSMFDSSEK